MYTIMEVTDPEQVKQEAMVPRPMGPGFTEEEADGATRLHAEGTGFSDPGPDHVLFHLTKRDGTVQTKRVEGY